MFSLPQRLLPCGFRLFLCLLAVHLCLPEASQAVSIAVSAQSSAILTPGSELIVSFGTWTYQAGNPGYSPNPTSLRFESLGPQIATSLSGMPGTSGQYYSGYSMMGYLESLDGSTVTPLIDPNAQRLGMPDGTLLFVPGTFASAGGIQEVAMLSASVSLSRTLADSLFGDAAAIPWTASARIVLVNSGPAMTFGLGDRYSVRSAFLEPGLGGAGPAMTSGVTLSVQMNTPSAMETTLTEGVPEPNTAGLLLSGLAAVFGLARRQKLMQVAGKRGQGKGDRRNN